MHVENKRIFVGNLPPYIEENDIRKQFSSYGKVVSVDVKQRKINPDENVSPVFAFVNIEIDNKTLQQCFHEISEYNWQGYYVKLELAKESFLDRLKREREEAQAKNVPAIPSPLIHSTPKQNGTVTPSKTVSKKKDTTSSSSSSSSSSGDSDSDDDKSAQNNKITPIKSSITVSKKKDSSSSSSSESDSSDEKPKKDNKTALEEPEDDDGIKLVIKSNKHKVNENGGIKIESFNSTPIHVITKKGVKNVQKDPKSLEADEKRKQSLLQMKNSYNQQKSAIRNALSRIDTQHNNSTFNNSENSNKRNYDENNFSASKKQKLALFNDEDDEHHEDNINFSVKSQFEGKQGQRLLELQSRYTNDKRFALDQRFAEDEEAEDNEMEAVGDDEKEKQLEILESVLGQKVRKNFKDDSKNSNIRKGMLRFDPSKPEHSKFEIKRSESTKKDKRKEKKEMEKVEEVPVPEVSKEKFYQVKSNLKESLKEKEGFSLLSMFGRAEEKDDPEEVPETSEEIKKNKQIGYDKNPFKYDSSDTEDEDPNKHKRKQQNKQEQVEERPAFKWSESFFFETNDNRLKDGLDFFKSLNNVGNFESFSEKRRAVNKVFQGKVRHYERDREKYMFKRKLNKRLKVKRAYKS